MSKVNEIQIHCTSCDTWFKSPIFFGDSKSFNTSKMIGNKVNCPSCNKTISCNKENMRVRHEDGGFVGIDT